MMQYPPTNWMLVNVHHTQLLMFKLPASNLQYVTSITFLLTTYSKYMAATKHTFNCGGVFVTPNTLRTVDNILGENPLRMSYMVGYGPYFPKRIHHRGSSLPSLSVHPQTIGCDGGFNPFFHSMNQNPNILVGAIVGGPNQNDGFPDDRGDYSQSLRTSNLHQWWDCWTFSVLCR
ncbi:putative cellulase [Medicago truncatula]|uniref:cellulase n=1 Tax=Medicago truncatula TaxID=3880 RepID=A0A396I918_MEDTR|nr:putative cellulase [Medicago truncatula]